jgi:copper transport protein
MYTFLVVTLSNTVFVYGHAIPDTYSLEPNSVIEKQVSFPTNIYIIFSERPDPKISYIHVADSAGQRIDNDDFNIIGQNGRQAAVTLDTSLIRDGVYSISWQALSLDDGHVAKGTYVVGVGDLTGNQGLPKDTQHEEQFSPTLAILKGPIIIGEVVVLGAVISQLYLWNDFSRLGLGSAIHSLSKKRILVLVASSSIVMAIFSTTLLMYQAVLISEKESNYFEKLSELFFQTSNGLLWILKLVCCIVLLSSIYFYNKIPPGASKNNKLISTNGGTASLCISLIAIGTFIAVNSSTSHSSSVEGWSQLGIVMDFIHTAIVSVWIGGLVYISYVFFPNIYRITDTVSEKIQVQQKEQKSVELITLARFSILGTISIGIITLTGLFLAWLHIHSAGELIGSDYGKTLIVKLSIALPVIILGAIHQFWITRISKTLFVKKDCKEIQNLKKFNLRSPSTLKSTIRIEAILMLFLLSAASLLTVTSPPTQDKQVMHGAMSDESMPTGIPHVFFQTLDTQGVPINFLVAPFAVGFNNFTVNFLNENQNISKIVNVSIELKKTDLSLSTIKADLERHNDTAFSAYGGYLSQEGKWDLKITVQRSDSYDLNYRLGLSINDSADIGDNDSIKQTGPNKSGNKEMISEFTPWVILLSVVLIVMTGLFSISAYKRLKAIQGQLGLQK